MRAARVVLAVALACSACADAALHAADGTPKRFSPRSVLAAETAWRRPDGALGVCVDMRLEPGAWRLRDPGHGYYAAEVPRETTSIPFEAWQDRSATGESGRTLGSCAVPSGACLLRLELVNGASLGEQKLRVVDARREVALLQLEGPRASGNPAFYPLVPLGYVGDVAALIVAIPVGIAVAFVVVPVALVVVAISGDHGAPMPPRDPPPMACEAMPSAATSATERPRR